MRDRLESTTRTQYYKLASIFERGNKDEILEAYTRIVGTPGFDFPNILNCVAYNECNRASTNIILPFEAYGRHAASDLIGKTAFLPLSGLMARVVGYDPLTLTLTVDVAVGSGSDDIVVIGDKSENLKKLDENRNEWQLALQNGAPSVKLIEPGSYHDEINHYLTVFDEVHLAPGTYFTDYFINVKPGKKLKGVRGKTTIVFTDPAVRGLGLGWSVDDGDEGIAVAEDLIISGGYVVIRDFGRWRGENIQVDTTEQNAFKSVAANIAGGLFRNCIGASASSNFLIDGSQYIDLESCQGTLYIKDSSTIRIFSQNFRGGERDITIDESADVYDYGSFFNDVLTTAGCTDCTLDSMLIAGTIAQPLLGSNMRAYWTIDGKNMSVGSAGIGSAFNLPTWPTASRPVLGPADEGTMIFDSTLNIPVFWDGGNWRNAAGVIV